jgi:hypothetical protein
VATSCWILAAKNVPRRVNWMQALCGLWLLIGSAVLLTGRLFHAALDDLIVGLLVLTVYVLATFAVLRDRRALA